MRPMAGMRTPGPQDAGNDPVEMDQGTLSRSYTPPPGPIGTTPRVELLIPSKLTQQDIEAALAAIRRETGTEAGEVLRDRIPELISILHALKTALSNPIFSPPTRRVSGLDDVFVLLGLDFLTSSRKRGSDELILALTMN